MSLVSTERQGDIVVITINNPPVNALSHGVRDGLLTQIVAADEDEACKAIVLRCDGRTFIAGADIKEFGKPPQEPSLPDVVARIENCSKPVVAALHGTALGGGLEVALGCHYRIAATSAAVGLPEVNLGLLPGASGTQRLPRLIGAEKALDIMLSGKPIDASSALAVGAIDRVSNAPDLDANALAFARDVITDGPRRISAMSVADVRSDFFAATRKKLADKLRGQVSPGRIIDCVEVATQTSFAEGLKKEREYFMQCLESPQSAGLRHAFFAEREVSKV
ncbi:MAG: enoyl-CoA hydratase/isomerase family protein, partial [Woeseiaceae bacterium]